MKASRAWLILIFLVFAVFPARADYHYASHEGSNEYPYTSWETGADSIQKAIDASSPHDTVYMGAGEWYESVAVGEYDSVAIIGMGWDSTYIWSDGYHIPTITLDYECSLEGVKVKHPTWKAIRHRAHSSIVIENCKIVDSYIGYMGGGGQVIIDNCVFDGNTDAIRSALWSSDLWVCNSVILNTSELVVDLDVYKAHIFNNIVLNEFDRFEFISRPAAPIDSVIMKNNIFHHGWFGRFSGGPHDIFVNNTVSDIRGPSNYAGKIAAYDGGVYDNNAIYFVDEAYFSSSDNPTISIRYNNFWGCDSNFVFRYPVNLDTTGIMHEYPMFFGETDFHLQAYSPLIDAGDPEISDIDGTRSDIGAYGGPGSSSYDYLDLAPLTPESIAAEVVFDDSTIYINWRSNYEADFDRYQIHRDTISGFQPSVFNMIAEPETSYYADADWILGQDYYYRIAAVDDQDNLSEYSEELAVLLTDIDASAGAELPTITTIDANYPNPFNSSTTIVYTVANLGPIPAEIKIEIYDILGRKVRTLLNERREVGKYRVTWNGKNDSGTDLPSGIYFAKIGQWGVDFLSRPVKLVLAK